MLEREVAREKEAGTLGSWRVSSKQPCHLICIFEPHSGFGMEIAAGQT